MSFVLYVHKLNNIGFPFPIALSNLFPLFSIDVWGPYTQHTYNSCSYFRTIVDDFTRCTWIFLMKNKSSVSHLTNFKTQNFIAKFKLFALTMPKSFVKALCYGYINLKEFFIKRVVATPRNKTVLTNESIDIYWRLLVLYFFNPKLPSNFGVNMCFVRALLLITCLCLASILFLVTRNYTVMLLLLLIFAILVVFAIFLHLSKVVRNFSLALIRVFFWDTRFAQKAYKVYNLITQKIIISRDVIFLELNVPFHANTSFITDFPKIYLPSSTPLPFVSSYPTHRPILSSLSQESTTTSQDNSNSF